MQYLFGGKTYAFMYANDHDNDVVGCLHDNVGYVNSFKYVDAAVSVYADEDVHVYDVENSVHLAVDVLDLVRPLFEGTKTPCVRSYSLGGFTRRWGHQLPTPALVELYQL